MTAADAWQPGPKAQAAAASMKNHRERVRHDPAALRCALGDAAHLLDAIRADMVPPKPLRGEAGRQAEAVARALRQAADAIWAMRDTVAPLPVPPSDADG